MLGMQMPTINADITNTSYDTALAKYFPSDNTIGIYYDLYIKAFKEVAEKVLSGCKVDKSMTVFKTPSCIELIIKIFHEGRHYYQKVTGFPSWEEETKKENEMSLINKSDVKKLQEYMNLPIEIDATSFALVATSILFHDSSIINIIDNIEEIEDKAPYYKKIKELCIEFKDLLL